MTESSESREIPTRAETAAAASKAKRAQVASTRARQRKVTQPKATKVMVYLVGTSHKGSDRQRRYLDPETAERLIRQGHARRP